MRIWSSLWRSVGSVVVVAAVMALAVHPHLVRAQSAPPEDQRIGPELAFYDEGSQRGVYEAVVLANGHTGTVQVANEVTLVANGAAPYNPAPGTNVVLRVVGIQPDTPLSTVRSYANGLRASASQFPAGTIVYLGNELNNLSLEYKSPTYPAETAPEAQKAVALQQAGRAYAAQYNEFAAALAGSGFRVAPGPPDLYNGLWDPMPWLQGFFSGFTACSQTDVLVLSIFDGVTPRIPGASDSLYGVVDAFEAYWRSRGCAKSVVHLAGIGVDPNVQPPIALADQVEFLDTFELREGIESAATLMIDPCENSNVTKSDWLYYIPKGQVYDASGLDVLTNNECGSRGSTAQPLIYPRTISELQPYLANSQVYCAPEQVFVPVATGASPDLNQCTDATAPEIGPAAGQVQDGVCTEYEYPLVPVDETWKVPSLSFPLTRGKGGISMETDLSRVSPGQTLAEAIESNARADYAPQFYLTTAEMQCTTVKNYLAYVQGVCDGFAAKKNSKERCAQDSKITLPSGGNFYLTQLLGQANGFFRADGTDGDGDGIPDNSCVNYLERARQDPMIEEIVRAVAPRAPKTFKMGFFVQHTKLYDKAGGESLQQRYLNTMLTMWLNVYTAFSGREPNKSTEQMLRSMIDLTRPSEKVTITPVWYNAGFAATPFDDHQTEAPYAVNPLSPEDAARAEFTADPAKFSGPLWATYAPVLTPNAQQLILRKRSQWVAGNNALIGVALGNLGSPNGVNLLEGFPQYMIDAESGAGPLIECHGLECLCARGDDARYSGLPLALQANCQGQPLAELRQAFPQTPPIVRQAGTPVPSEVTPENDPNLVPSNTYLRTLKRFVLARINAGRQMTRPYVEGEGVGPLTVRTLQRCNNEAYTSSSDYAELYGQQETALSINTKAQQSGTKGPLQDVVNYFSAKVRHLQREDGRDITGTFAEDRVSAAYLVLPDDAVTLESIQEYTTPAFFSPEMYDLIVRGESDALPFNQGKTETDKPSFLSAMLRTFGLSRDLTTEEQGYAQYEEIRYQCRGFVPTTVIPNQSGQRQLVWRRYPSEAAEPKCPTSEGIAIAYQPVEKSLVNVQGNVDGVPSNPNPETAGGLAAVNEYLRRMAFTPLHMQPFAKYPGLEKFYAGKPDPSETAYDPSQVSGQCVYKNYNAYNVWDELSQIMPGQSDYRPILNAAACETVRNAGIDTGAGNAGTYGRQLAALVRTILSVEGGRYLDAAAGINSNADGMYQCQPNRYGALGPMALTVGQCAEEGTASVNFGLNRNTLDPDICTLRGALQSGFAKLQGDFQAGMQQAQTLASLQPVAGINNGTGASEQLQRRRLYAAYELAAEAYLGRGACGCMSFNRNDPGCSGDYGSDGAIVYHSEGTANDYCQYVAQSAMGAFANVCQ